METAIKNRTLSSLADLILKNKQAIIGQNKKDMDSCKDLDDSLLDRLKVDEKKVAGMVTSIEQVIKAGDPVGRLLNSYHPENGLKIENRTVPFGLILIIYESRPDVTIEAAVAAFKAGNTILLKGGKEALHTNTYLVELWHQALALNGLSKEWVSYLNFNREETRKLILENTLKIDLIIPRGGDSLINFVTSHTSVPVIVSGRGNNFMYVDSEADFDMALDLILNGKSRLSVCNALDKVLFNKDISGLLDKLNTFSKTLNDRGIEVFGTESITAFANNIKQQENDGMIDEEFLSAKILFALTGDLNEAIKMINRHSGGHSAVIVTNNRQTAEEFQNKVDCAAVYHNASSRFTDGGEFGFGAEIAISTQKLHFRGPVGLDQLVTNKWFITGSGQVRK